MENFIFCAMQWSNTRSFVSNKDPRSAHFVPIFPFTSTFSSVLHHLLYNTAKYEIDENIGTNYGNVLNAINVNLLPPGIQ